MGLITMPIILLLIAAGVWYWLSSREQKRAEQGLPRHSGVRLFIATFAILITVFAGGCGSLFLIGWIIEGMPRNSYVGWEVVSVFSLPPLLIGGAIWWLAMQRPK